MNQPLIEVRDLTHAYPDGTEALRGVFLHIRAGESVAVVGANGAGKSTLLLHLNGSLIPQHGTVRIGDFQVAKTALPNIRRTVGMVFQDPDDQLFMPTVAEDVAFGPLNLKLPPEEVERRVVSALDQVGAGHLRDRPPYKLSGGEKRLAAIATVLAMAPAILVMDEPSSSLDPCARRTLIELLAGFRHTKIIATHDLDLVLDLCPRTIVLREGRVMAAGPTGDIFADDRLLTASRLEPPLRLQACPACGRSGKSGWLPEKEECI